MTKSYKVELSKQAIKELKKLDNPHQFLLMNWIEKNLVNCKDPRFSGKVLQGKLKGYWRYRVGDYRLICDIVDDEIIIVVIHVGHRKQIYKK